MANLACLFITMLLDKTFRKTRKIKLQNEIILLLMVKLVA
jgi:hypothetical protein